MPRELPEGRPRNERLVDWWSLTHLAWAAGLVFLVGPFWSLVLMTIWEPLEVLVVSRLAARWGISFGHESLKNSLTDHVFNVAGVLLGAVLAQGPRFPLYPPAWP